MFSKYTTVQFFVHFSQELFQINFFYACSTTRCSHNSDIKMIRF